jgi:hypothetical protein
VGDEYEEQFEYEYNSSVFKQKLKVWVPTSPKKNSYDYAIWEGDETNILFNYPYFNAHFVKIDIRLVPKENAGINDVAGEDAVDGAVYDLLGRPVNVNVNVNKGVYISGKRKIVK